MVELRLRPDASAVATDDAFDERQTHARPLELASVQPLEDAEELLKNAEVIVVGHADVEARRLIVKHAAGRRIVDLSGYADLRDVPGSAYEGICW